MEFSKEHSLEVKEKIYNAIPKELHKVVDDIYSSKDYDNFSPVTRLEQELGISDIGQKYKFPNNMDPIEFEELMKPVRIFEFMERGMVKPHSEEEQQAIEYLQSSKPRAMFEVRMMYNELIKLNPELKEAVVNPNEFKSYVAVISGACSGFPKEDIIEFSEARSEESNMAINQRKYKQSEELTILTGKDVAIENWCPSEKTFNKVVAKISAKQNNNQKSAQTSYENYIYFIQSRGGYDD